MATPSPKRRTRRTSSQISCASGRRDPMWTRGWWDVAVSTDEDAHTVAEIYGEVAEEI